jgi:hypothetical protein
VAVNHIQLPILDDAGNLLAGTSVEYEVRDESDNSLAALFSDRAGATPIVNPVTTTDGYVDAYVQGGAYKIVASATVDGSPFETTLRYVAKGLLGEVDTDQLSTIIAADLPTKINLIKLFRGTPDITDWEADPDSVTDWAEAAENAVYEAYSEGFGEIRIPPGNWDLGTLWTIPYPINVCGFNVSTSILEQLASTGVHVSGEFGTGGKFGDCTIALATPSGTPSYNYSVTNFQDSGDPTDHYSPDFHLTENLNCTLFSGNPANYNVLFDGNDRSDSNGSTISTGLRNVQARRISSFGANTRACEMRNVRGFQMDFAHFFQSLGSADVYVGSSHSGDPTNYGDGVKINGLICGDLILERLVVGNFDVEQMIDLTAANTASAVFLKIVFGGSDPTTEAGDLVNSRVISVNWDVDVSTA